MLGRKKCKEKLRGLQSIDFIGSSAFRPVLLNGFNCAIIY